MRPLPRIQWMLSHLKRFSVQLDESILKRQTFARLRQAAKAILITTTVVAVVPVLLLSTRKGREAAATARVVPVRSIPLTLTGEIGRLSLAWYRRAPAIQAQQCGILWIADGGIHRRLIMDASQLRAGKL